MSRMLVVAALLLLVGLAIPLGRLTAAPELTAAEKVSPFALAATEDGATASFFVVLTEKANLNGARTLDTKEAKGAFVYNALYDVAEQSQAPLRAALDTWKDVTFNYASTDSVDVLPTPTAS